MLYPRAVVRQVAAFGLVTVLLTSCSGNTIDRDELEQQAATELAAAVGQDEPNISCPDDLEAEVGATIECDLSVEGDEDVYPVYIEVTSVEGGRATFDVEVGESPR